MWFHTGQENFPQIVPLRVWCFINGIVSITSQCSCLYFSIFSGSAQILSNLQKALQVAELPCDSMNAECTQLPHPQVEKGKSEKSEEGNRRNRWEKEKG